MLNINFTLLDGKKEQFPDLSVFYKSLYLPIKNEKLEIPNFYSIDFIHNDIKMKAIYFKDKFLAVISEQPIQNQFIFFKNQDSAIFIKQNIISHLKHINYTYPTIDLI